MDPTTSTTSGSLAVTVSDPQGRWKPPPIQGQLPPPYWQHRRSISHVSQISVDRPRPITLRDRTESISSSSGALWAKSISIEDYVIVRGNVTGIGDYVVWICKVQTLDVSIQLKTYDDNSLANGIQGGPMVIRKR